MNVKRTLTTAVLISAVSVPALGQDLLTNGDFEGGISGFNTSYTFNSGGIATGVYDVRSDPEVWNPGLAACNDHTSGSGLMLCLNGSTVAGISAWNATITVAPNTFYAISFWAQSLSASNPPTLQVDINSSPIGTIALSSTVCTWQNFSFTWASGANTSLTLDIEDLTTAGGGNDFALDDMSIIAHGLVVTTTSAFTIAGGSNSLEIVKEIQDNWRLSTTFGCKVVGDSLVVTGLDPATPCFNEQKVYRFKPDTADGKTSGAIDFRLRLTCASVTGELKLDSMGFVTLMGPSTAVMADNGDTIDVRVSSVVSSGSLNAVPAFGTGALVALAVCFLAVGAAAANRHARVASTR